MQNTITDIFNLSNRREAEPVLIEEMDIPTGKEPKVAKPEKAVEPEKADKPEQAAAAEAQAVMTQNQLEQVRSLDVSCFEEIKSSPNQLGN